MVLIMDDTLQFSVATCSYNYNKQCSKFFKWVYTLSV